MLLLKTELGRQLVVLRVLDLLQQTDLLLLLQVNLLLQLYYLSGQGLHLFHVLLQLAKLEREGFFGGPVLVDSLVLLLNKVVDLEQARQLQLECLHQRRVPFL